MSLRAFMYKDFVIVLYVEENGRATTEVYDDMGKVMRPKSDSFPTEGIAIQEVKDWIDGYIDNINSMGEDLKRADDAEDAFYKKQAEDAERNYQAYLDIERQKYLRNDETI